MGIGLGSAIAVYFIIWWILLFAVLPWGRRDPDPEDATVAGADRGAPAQPRLWRKLIITTIGSGFIFAAFLGVLNSGLTLEDIPLPSPPGLDE
ncbi:MAG: DUF1467 family protein [Pseudomonadota bacterium]